MRSDPNAFRAARVLVILQLALLATGSIGRAGGKELEIYSRNHFGRAAP